MAADDLFDAAGALLSAAIDALAKTPGGVPARRFVSHSPPPLDCCPLAAVHVAAVDYFDVGPSANPDRRITTPGQLIRATLVLTIARCVPSFDSAGGFPPSQALTDSAAILAVDLWIVVNHLRALKRAGTLFGDACREVTMQPAVPLANAGACGGWLIPVQVQIDGYTPA